MIKVFVFISMIFCHIIDDYKLQAGVLNNLKQKSWWEENAPDPLYKYDYIMGLIMHSISWSFMIMLPIALYYKLNINVSFICVFIVNACVHGVIDDIKANRKKINLITDQLLHMFQITITAIAFLFL